MSSNLIPGYDRWLDDPFQRDMDARAEAAESDDEEETEEPDDDDRIPIPCSNCGKDTNWDPIYQDLCYRCCRADNE